MSKNAKPKRLGWEPRWNPIDNNVHRQTKGATGRPANCPLCDIRLARDDNRNRASIDAYGICCRCVRLNSLHRALFDHSISDTKSDIPESVVVTRAELRYLTIDTGFAGRFKRVCDELRNTSPGSVARMRARNIALKQLIEWEEQWPVWRVAARMLYSEMRQGNEPAWQTPSYQWEPRNYYLTMDAGFAERFKKVYARMRARNIIK